MNPNFRNLFSFLVLFLLLVSCSQSGDNNNSKKATDVAEKEDREKIEEYLKTHFYNYEDFQNPPENFDYKVIIRYIEGTNSEKTPLSKQVKSKKVMIDKVSHTLNYIVVKEGLGESPKFTDSILTTYRGELLNGKVFDSRSKPLWQDLTSSIQGWSQSFPFFKTSKADPIENDDGTIDFKNDGGIGIIIFPSALGYFSATRSGIPSYSPLVFSLNLLKYKETDHDNDDIASYLEDVDGDGFISDDDTDDDLTPNYRDSDDDDDGTSTKKEYDANKDGIVDDTDGDGIPDYLDKT